MKCIECILGIYALHTMEVEKNVYCVLHCIALQHSRIFSTGHESNSSEENICTYIMYDRCSIVETTAWIAIM